MSSKKQLDIRLTDCKAQIQLSIEQIHAYNTHDNIIVQNNLKHIINNIETVVVKLQGACENSRNISSEIYALARKEMQRRCIQEKFAQVEERGLVKKTATPWYLSDYDSQKTRRTTL